MNIHFNTKKDFKFIEVFPTAGALGAQIENINLSEDLSEEIITEIYDALLTYQVIFFRDQEFNPKSQKAFAKKIGKPIYNLSFSPDKLINFLKKELSN